MIAFVVIFFILDFFFLFDFFSNLFVLKLSFVLLIRINYLS